MKRIILFSLLLLASVAMTSCTADENPVPIQNQVADDTGGQTGTLPPPPPPPGGGRLSNP